MHTQELIDIATGKISDLVEVQTTIDDRAERCSGKRDANDLGFLVGLNGKLSNDVNPFAGGPLAVAFDLGHAEKWV